MKNAGHTLHFSGRIRTRESCFPLVRIMGNSGDSKFELQ